VSGELWNYCVVLGFCKGRISEYCRWLLWYDTRSYTVSVCKNCCQ